MAMSPRRLVARRILDGWFGFAACAFVCTAVVIGMIAQLALGTLARSDADTVFAVCALGFGTGISAAILLRRLRRDLAEGAALFPEGPRLLTLLRCLHHEKPTMPPIAWREEWASFFGFARDGLAGRGWILPRMPQDPSTDPMAVLAAVAEAVRDARRRSGKTQEEVAWKAGISIRTLKRIEATGRGKFSSLSVVCEVLGTNVPNAPVDGPPTPFRPWVLAVGNMALLGLWFSASAPFWLTLTAVTRRQKATALAVVACFSLLVSVFVRIHLWAGTPFQPDEDGIVAASIARNTSVLLQIGNAFSLLLLATGLAGFLGGAAWRSRNAQAASLLGAACAASLMVAAIPMQRIQARLHDRMGEVTADLQTYTAVEAAVMKRVELVPGYDVHKAETFEAMPWLYRSTGVPVPEWMRNVDAYDAHNRKMTSRLAAFRAIPPSR